MTHAVLVCPGCRRPFAVELRHQSAHCPGCHGRVDVRGRRRLYEGDANGAARATALARAGGKEIAAPSPLVRHDDPVAAAAAAGKGIINQSRRSEAVAMTLCRLVGRVCHDDLVAALLAAGIDDARAEREIHRLLATDLLTEPTAGHYRWLS